MPIAFERVASMTETGAIGVSRGRIGISLPVAFGLLVYLAGLATPKARIPDPDIMMHIAIGRWIVEHLAVPHVEFLSYTMAGRKWVPHEWFGEVVTAVVYDRLGWHGLVALASLCLGAALAIFMRALLRYFQPAQALIVTAAAWVLLAMHWLARPHIFALPILVLWMALLVEAREENRRPPLAAALLLIPWANLHGSFLVGLGFAGLLALEAVVASAGMATRLAAAKSWGAFIGLAVLAGLVTPNGIETYLLPFRLLDMSFALSVLGEWKSVDFQTMQTVEVWLLLFLGVVLYRGIKLPFSRLLMILLLLSMALKHVRHADLLAFIAPLLAAPAAASQLARRTLGKDVAQTADWLTRLARPARARGMALAGLVAVAGTALAATRPLVPNDLDMPAAAVRAVAERGIAGRVLNDYNYGDFLIFSGIKPFVDGRAELYGDAFLKRLLRATGALSGELPVLLTEYDITWTLFPIASQAVVLLDRLPGWHRLYADDIAVVHVRDGTAAQAK